MQGTGTYIANLNAETQIVIAGADEGMAAGGEARAGKRREQGYSGWR